MSREADHDRTPDPDGCLVPVPRGTERAHARRGAGRVRSLRLAAWSAHPGPSSGPDLGSPGDGPAVPAAGDVPAARRGPACMGGRSRARPRLPRPPDRGPPSGRATPARRAHRADPLPAARPGTAAVAAGAASVLTRGLPPATPFNVPVGGTRRFAMAEIPLEEARAVKGALGGTVNDVILTAVAGGVSRLLESRGEPTEGLRYRTMMPVSLRSDSEHGSPGNRVTTVYPDLPVGPMEPLERLRGVREETQRMKASTQGRAATVLIQGTMWIPPAVHRGLGRWGNRHLRIFNMVASNIPGPQVPIYLDGTRLVAYYPLMPLGATVALSVGIVTLVGVMGFGFTADWDAVPDLELLALEVGEEFDALKKAAHV